MSVSRVDVTYKSPKIDEELDKKILDFFNKLDFICIDRAYMPMLGRRQLDFERHTKEERDGGYKSQYHLKPAYVEEEADEGNRSKEAQLTT